MLRKITFITVLFVSWSLFGYGQDESDPTIDFSISWKDVKKKSKAKNKPIFIFAGLDNCGVSAKVRSTTFYYKDVYELFNEKFICYYLNIGVFEGKVRGNTWKVRTSPEYLFYNAQKKIFYREKGYKSKEDMVEMANKALAKVK